MAIHVSEPGRPTGTRLPEIFRSRRVGSLEETSASHALRESSEEISDGAFQQAREVHARRAVAHYSQAVHPLTRYRRNPPWPMPSMRWNSTRYTI